MEITESDLDFRIATGGSNWVGISSQVMIGLGGGLPYPGRPQPWPDGGTLGVISTGNDWTASSALRMIGRGEAEAAITTPPATAHMARKGKGHFVEEVDLAAVAKFPHDDWLGFAVQADSEIESLAQIRDERLGINLARAPSAHPPYSNITGFLLDEVFKQYNLSSRKLREWGGTVNDGGRKLVEEIIEGDYDALFDEAMMTPDWREITHNADLRFLSLDEDVISFISGEFGFGRGVIPEGYLPGVVEDTPTLSMSSWLFVIDSTLPESVGYHVVRALDERKDKIHRFFESKSADYTNPPLSDEIDLSKAWKDTQIPLHPGAARYYEEHGYKKSSS